MPIPNQIQEKFQQAVFATHDFRGDETIVVKHEALIDLMRFLKNDSEFLFDFLMDLTAVDYLNFGEARPRFEIVYHLYSSSKNKRLRVKVSVEEENSSVPTVTAIWPAADWYEREVWDMFGIRFIGHSNLKRILMYEEFVGHPLRRDYPVNKRQPLIGPKN